MLERIGRSYREPPCSLAVTVTTQCQHREGTIVGQRKQVQPKSVTAWAEWTSQGGVKCSRLALKLTEVRNSVASVARARTDLDDAARAAAGATTTA